MGDDVLLFDPRPIWVAKLLLPFRSIGNRCKYETQPCSTALNLRMRVRNVGEMCAGKMDDLQGDNDADDADERWKEACRREEAIRDLLSR
jgi:hypothetical protein